MQLIIQDGSREDTKRFSFSPFSSGYSKCIIFYHITNFEKIYTNYFNLSYPFPLLNFEDTCLFSSVFPP
jgi:hypothetical protein